MSDHDVVLKMLAGEKEQALDAILATTDDLESIEQQITTLTLRKDEYLTFIEAKRVLVLELASAISALKG